MTSRYERIKLASASARTVFGLAFAAHRRGQEQKSEAPRSPILALLKTLFRLFLVVGLLVGVCLILWSSSLKPDEAGAGHAHEWLVDLTRDLGIGVVVSVFVVVFIEWRAGLTLRSEIARDVLEAVYERVVPMPIYKQVRDNIFRSDVVRRDWTVAIEVVDIPGRSTDGVGDIVVVESTMSYKLRNLNDRAIAFTVSGGVDLNVACGERDDIPRFQSIEVDGGVWGRDKGLDEATGLKLLEDASEIALVDGLLLNRDGVRQIRFRKEVVFGREHSIQVKYTVLRAIRVPGTYVLSSPAPAEGITIDIKPCAGVAFDVLPLHPQADEISGEKSSWRFGLGILPWQGFRIMCSHETGDPR